MLVDAEVECGEAGVLPAAFYIFLATIFTFFAGFAMIGYVRVKTEFANIMVAGGAIGLSVAP